MKGYVQWNHVYNRKDFCLQWDSNLELLDQHTSAYTTKLQGLHENVTMYLGYKNLKMGHMR